MNTLDVLKFIKSENKLESKININNCEFNVSFKGCYYIYINDATIMDREMLNDSGIEVDDSEKVLAKNKDKDLYLISNY